MARPDELTFAPLGGVGEIGMNLSIYGLGNRHQRSWLAVDLCVSFGDEERLPGIDLIMPDIRFLQKERKNLVGLVLTHAHEDHFGAIIDLWPSLKCPIYATKFSAALFEAKCNSERNPPKIPVTVVPSGGRIELGPFGVEFIPVAHSIPESRAVADAAKAAGREVVVIGRAMERVVQVARETGHLDGVQEFRGADMYGHFPPDKVLALCTGSQGEPRAALARIANDDHPQVTLNKGDCVIFSSRTIPGNEKAVGAIINGLITQGIDVITDRTDLVHVSGHPRRDELRDMISWVRPQLLIPVHGEALHLSEHAKLARAAGLPKVLICRNGDPVRLAPGDPGIIDELPSGRLYKDGNILEDSKSRAVVERRRMGFAGCAFVAIAMTDKGELADDPEVDLVGIPEKNAAGEVIDEIVFDTVVSTVENLPRARRRDADATAESVRRAVRAVVNEHWGKKPICLVHVLTV